MDYKVIKETIQSDYVKVAQVKSINKGGRCTMRTFYLSYSKALNELNRAVGPFILTTEQFIEHIKYIKDSTDKEVYNIILYYCKDKFNLIID